LFLTKKKGKGEKKQFENNLRFVGDFATVEDFWSYFNNMRKPSGLESNSLEFLMLFIFVVYPCVLSILMFCPLCCFFSSTGNYHVFKNGIKPMWEDPQNNKGGKWILLLKGSQKDKLNE
jgi:translation initiation factor 4E